MGIKYIDGLAVTGVKRVISGWASPGPRVAMTGEFDGSILYCDSHPEAQTPMNVIAAPLTKGIVTLSSKPK